jgi:nucleoside-diphosphate-sugar epimerase
VQEEQHETVTPAELSSARVAVTGATGFLGGHVLRLLRSTHATVFAIVDRGRTARHAPDPSVQTIWFGRPDEIAGAVRSVRPDYVIHLHAVITTARDAGALDKTVEGNLLPSLALMVACRPNATPPSRRWAILVA